MREEEGLTEERGSEKKGKKGQRDGLPFVFQDFTLSLSCEVHQLFSSIPEVYIMKLLFFPN